MDTSSDPSGSNITYGEVRATNVHNVAQSSRAGTFGSDYDWNPFIRLAMAQTWPAQPTSPFFPNGIYPWANTDFNNSTWPNQWAPLNAHAIYMDGLWPSGTGERARDFAYRTQHMLGGMFASGINFETGKDLTRKQPYAKGFDGKFDGKYSIGSLSLGTIL